MKDAEKSMVGNSESYSTFKAKLEKLPNNVVVIGSHTHTDNRKEKVLMSLRVLTFNGLYFFIQLVTVMAYMCHSALLRHYAVKKHDIRSDFFFP